MQNALHGVILILRANAAGGENQSKASGHRIREDLRHHIFVIWNYITDYHLITVFLQQLFEIGGVCVLNEAFLYLKACRKHDSPTGNLLHDLTADVVHPAQNLPLVTGHRADQSKNPVGVDLRFLCQIHAWNLPQCLQQLCFLSHEVFLLHFFFCNIKCDM